MLPLAVQIIRAEHDALAAMLRTLPLVATPAGEPDFEALRAMLFYVDEFPERLHHPKESDILFPKLRARAPELREVLDDLDHDHGQGERAIRELQHSLLAWEQMGEPRRDKFQQQLQTFIHRYLRHMRREETEVLPSALKLLQAQDWAELDEAFEQNRDPLASPMRADSVYAPLRERILRSLPPPLGWGTPAP
jgi:hemerythrin-like domain-containing protein